jgi:hypothetical protein
MWVDWYGLGLCLFEGAVTPAGVACHVALTVHLLHAGQYEWPKEKPLSAECKDLLSKIFVADPAARISIAQIQVQTSLLACYYICSQLCM